MSTKGRAGLTHHVPLGEEEVGPDVLEVMSEALLQPDVLPPDRGHQVTEPLGHTGGVMSSTCRFTDTTCVLH